jgi:hypothetical protein
VESPTVDNLAVKNLGSPFKGTKFIEGCFFCYEMYKK